MRAAGRIRLLRIGQPTTRNSRRAGTVVRHSVCWIVLLTVAPRVEDEMPIVRVNGTQLYYEEVGVGEESVVFMHGLAWGTRLFRAQAEALRDHYRCIVFESRGHGLSEIARRGYELENLAVDAAELIGKLQAGPCHLVAHSLGASVALRVAIRSPELVRSLVLFDAAADEDPFWDRLLYRLMSYGLQMVGMWAGAGTLVRKHFGKTFRKDPTRAAERAALRQVFRSQNKHGIARAVRGWIRSPAIEGELHRVAVPTLVVAGEEDTSVKPNRSRKIADKVQHGKFELLPRCGHTVPIEATQVANRLLTEFLAGVKDQVVQATR